MAQICIKAERISVFYIWCSPGPVPYPVHLDFAIFTVACRESKRLRFAGWASGCE